MYNLSCQTLSMVWFMCQGRRQNLPFLVSLVISRWDRKTSADHKSELVQGERKWSGCCRLLDGIWWREILSSCSLWANTHPRKKPCTWWHPQQRHHVPPQILKSASLAGKLGLVLVKWFYHLNSLQWPPALSIHPSSIRGGHRGRVKIQFRKPGG